MSSKVRVRFSPPRRAAKRDCASCMRPGRTGTGRSSPSEKSPADAVTRNAYAPARRGAEIRKTASAPAPGFAVKAAAAESAVSPKADSALAFVSVSRMSSVTRPESGRSDALLTTTFSSAASPSRRKRGT